MRSRGLFLACTAMFVVTLGLVLSAQNDKDKSGQNPNKSERARIAQGFNISPVPLNMTGLDKDLVGLGSYLVNAAGGCNGCHTWPNYVHGSDPFTGVPKQVNTNHYLAGGRPFGPFTSRNLTRVPETHDLNEFLLMMRTGIDPHQAHLQISPLLQVMPWPDYQDLTDHDLRAIYEYLTAIPDAVRCASVGPISATQTDPTCVP